MTEKTKNELEIIKESVLKAVPATAIYLFGSHAYGESDNDSDLDIYVVVPEKSMCSYNMQANIKEDFYKKVPMSVDLLIRDEEYFEYRRTAPTLERKIFREGIKVHG